MPSCMSLGLQWWAASSPVDMLTLTDPHTGTLGCDSAAVGAASDQSRAVGMKGFTWSAASLFLIPSFYERAGWEKAGADNLSVISTSSTVGSAPRIISSSDLPLMHLQDDFGKGGEGREERSDNLRNLRPIRVDDLWQGVMNARSAQQDAH